MQLEHEEAMRSDFREQAALHERIYVAGVTLDEIKECFSKGREIHGRWISGPHAEQWRWLFDVYNDFRSRPETMERIVDDVEFNRAHGCDRGLDEVQYRSLMQARELTAPDGKHTRPRTRGQISRER
ncbi:hypothetical protein [Nocardia jejuensis]|uniref:hypothetical protein n=1 Tax=Nocardia jejuensis TaxID=328049 RepID=UPI0008319967|nr:hypothetical protein [Nocardia jejuensis]